MVSARFHRRGSLGGSPNKFILVWRNLPLNALALAASRCPDARRLRLHREQSPGSAGFGFKILYCGSAISYTLMILSIEKFGARTVPSETNKRPDFNGPVRN